VLTANEWSQWERGSKRPAREKEQCGSEGFGHFSSYLSAAAHIMLPMAEIQDLPR